MKDGQDSKRGKGTEDSLELGAETLEDKANAPYRLLISRCRQTFLEEQVFELRNSVFQKELHIKKLESDIRKQASAIEKQESNINQLESHLAESQAALKKAKTLAEIVQALAKRLSALHSSLTWKLTKPLISALLNPGTLGAGKNVLKDVDGIIDQYNNWVADSGFEAISIPTQNNQRLSEFPPRTSIQGPLECPTSLEHVSKGEEGNFSDLLKDSNRKFRIGLAVTESEEGSGAGDYYTARELASALKTELGWECNLLGKEDSDRNWYDLRNLDCLLVLLNDYDLRQIPEHFNGVFRIAWVRNWTDQWTASPWFSRFDLVLCTSEIAKSYIEERTGKSAAVFRIATNGARFGHRIPPVAEFKTDYCFTGNYWGAQRRIEQFSPGKLPYQFGLFGRGWQNHVQFADAYRGEVPYQRIPEVYASSQLLIDDANHVTLPWGSINSRVFDALATGTLVLTNGKAGAREVFGDLLPTFNSTEDLEQKVTYFLEHPEERDRKAGELRDIVLKHHSYTVRAHELNAILGRELDARNRIAIKVPVPESDDARFWGDFHFANALARSLRELGHAVRIDLMIDWYLKRSMVDDVVITLRGLSRYQPDPRQLNLLWIISHPNEVTSEECDSFDHVFVASEIYAERLAHRTKTPVSPLLQCTDIERFKVDSQTERSGRLLFVGNTRNQFRPIVRHAIEAGLSPMIIGRGWEQYVDESLIECEYLDNKSLPPVYAASGAVLCDHWPDMREHGFISNRIFDVVASGALPVSDNVVGIKELFGKLVCIYDGTPNGLFEAISTALVTTREMTASRFGQIEGLMMENSFGARAEYLSDFIAKALPIKGAKSKPMERN